MMRLQKTEMLLIVAALLLGLSSLISPDWLVFTSTLAIAAALVVMGVVMLMRAGLISFGQGLFYLLIAGGCLWLLRRRLRK